MRVNQGVDSAKAAAAMAAFCRSSSCNAIIISGKEKAHKHKHKIFQ